MLVRCPFDQIETFSKNHLHNQQQQLFNPENYPSFENVLSRNPPRIENAPSTIYTNTTVGPSASQTPIPYKSVSSPRYDDNENGGGGGGFSQQQLQKHQQHQHEQHQQQHSIFRKNQPQPNNGTATQRVIGSTTPNPSTVKIKAQIVRRNTQIFLHEH